MVNISIDVTDLGGEARPGDKVVFWRPRVGGSATHAGRVISTAPVTVFLTDGKATVSDVEPGEMTVLLQCRGVESQGPVTVGVPDGDHTVTLRALLESQFEYAPPIVSAVQEAAANASASERAAIEAQVRSEAAADRADAKVDDAINNGANLIRNEVKQDADRAVSARQAATQSESNAAASEGAAASSASNAAASETNAKQSETNAGDYAAVATTAATEAVDAMERATEIAGGDFATHEYVDQKVASVTLTGTGSPEGKVTASVGTTYTDTAATNGAIRWAKTSGTGSAGWAVEYGDTGWRDVTALIPRAVLEGQMLIRRTTTMASIYFYNLLLEDSGLSYQDFGNFLSSGFYDPAIQYFYVGGLANRGANYAAGAVRISRFGGLRIQDVGPGQYMTGMVSLTTGKAWPSTLPGTPA